MKKVYYIAELGSCHHHAELETRFLIQSLKAAKVNAIKMQYWSDGLELARVRGKNITEEAVVMKLGEDYEKWKTDITFIRKTAEFCHELGLDFICSVFLKDDVKVLEQIVTHYKIASLEAKDRELLYEVDKYSHGKAILISTGCSTQSDMVYFRQMRQGQFTPPLHSPVMLFHCITEYPAPIHNLNLSVIYNNGLDGYSDHSKDILAGAAAVLHGAKYLEFHVKHLQTPIDCPDFKHSLGPDEVNEYIQNCERVRVMSGEMLREVTEGEKKYLMMKR